MAMALWESNGASTTVFGSLAQPVRNAIFGLFQLAYSIAKRCWPFTDLGPDYCNYCNTGGWNRGTCVRSAQEIVHAIAAPMRTSEGVAVKESTFFALASDSSTDRAVNKQELVYT